MECQNCRATSTAKKYPGKVGTLCIPCWNRRVATFQEERNEEFEAKWLERAERWGSILGTGLFYVACLLIVGGFGAVMWWWLA